MARILLLHPDSLRRSLYRKVLEADGHEVSEASLPLHELLEQDRHAYDRIETEIPDLTQDALECSLLHATGFRSHDEAHV